MKRILVSVAPFILLLALFADTANADVYSRRLGQRLMIPFKIALDSSGQRTVPDSIQVTTMRDDGTQAQAFRNFTYTQALAASGWFDTTKNGGYPSLVLNVYTDSIAGTTPTGHMINVWVTPYAKLIGFEQTASVWVTAHAEDSLAYYAAVRAIVDSSAGIGALVDSIWDEDTTGHKTAPNMGWAITQGGSATISDADITKWIDSLLNRNLSFGATDTFPQFAKLLYMAGDSTRWLDTTNFKTAMVNVATANPTLFNDMAYISGDATAAANLEAALDGTGGVTMKLLQLDIGGAVASPLNIHSSTGGGMTVTTTLPGANAVTFSAINAASGNGSGLALWGAPSGVGMTINDGLYIRNSDGIAVDIESANNYGLRITSSSTDAARLIAGGNGSGFNAIGAGSGSGIVGTGGPSGSGGMLSGYLYGLYASASQLGGAGFFGYAPGGHAFSGYSFAGEPNFHGTLDSVAGIGSGGGGATAAEIATAIRDTAANRPELFYGPTNSGIGLTFGVNIWVVDTGATPDAGIQAANVSIVTLAGAFVSGGQTNDSGVVRLSADAGTYQIRAFRPPFSMTVKTIVVTADVDSTQIPAYNGVTGSKCMVWGSLVDYGLNAVRYVPVTFTFAEAINPSDGSILINRTVKATSGVDGTFNATLIRSSKLQNKPWTMTIGEGVSPLKRQVTVPDSTSYKIAW